MKRIIALVAALGCACSSVDSRAGCAASTDCPQGQYCAATAEGNVCWADAVAPVVSTVEVTCDTDPCLRGGVLHVSATISDDREVLDAAVGVDLGSGPPVALARSGDSWTADVPLRSLPFEAFSRAVVATVTARDGARNVAPGVQGAPVQVTRLLWERVVDPTVGFKPTVPAVMRDGTVVLGGSTGKLYFIAPDGTEAHPPLAVGNGQITAAPAIGERAIWVGSEDYWLYGVALEGPNVIAQVGVNTEGAVRGLAELGQPDEEWAFASASSGRIGFASTSALDYAKSPLTGPFTTGPVVLPNGNPCAVSTTVSATLRCYSFDGAFAENWNVNVGSSVTAPLAIDGDSDIWTASQDGTVCRTKPEGTSMTVTLLSRPVADSPVVLASGEAVIGDESGSLSRVTREGVFVWSKKLNGQPSVDEPLLAPIVLSGPSSFVVPTKNGSLYALDENGTTSWVHSVVSNAELRAGNIYTPPNQPGLVLSIAFFSATNGKLYAVLVDGELDASAPWPKAFHDPQNTNRAGPQP